MYKPRNKYFTTNAKDLVKRILSQKGHFTPYEFMALRYACCQEISRLYSRINDLKDHPIINGVIYTTSRACKQNIKKLQTCINYLDNWYCEAVNGK